MNISSHTHTQTSAVSLFITLKWSEHINFNFVYHTQSEWVIVKLSKAITIEKSKWVGFNANNTPHPTDSTGVANSDICQKYGSRQK